MTNQEAITIIGNLEDKDMLFNPCDVQDAKTMAIKALEQEPCKDIRFVTIHCPYTGRNYIYTKTIINGKICVDIVRID